MMEENLNDVRPRLGLPYIIVVGFFAPLIATGVARATGLFESWYFPVIGLIYFGVAFVFAFLLPHRLLAQIAILYVLIPLGSFFDATVDNYFFDSGRNLWGMEVIVLLILVPFPLLLGAVVGRYSVRRRSAIKHKEPKVPESN